MLGSVETPSRAALVAEAAAGPALALAPVAKPHTVIQRFFEQHVLLDSATAAVLRAVEQAMVMPAVLWLKRHTRILSKDITTPDGWSVSVHLPRASVAAQMPASGVPQSPRQLVARSRASLAGEAALASASRAALSPLATVVTHTRKERGLSDSAAEFFLFTMTARFVLEPRQLSLDRAQICFPSVLYDSAQVLPAVKDALEVLALWNAHSTTLRVPLDRLCEREARPVPAVMVRLCGYLLQERPDRGIRTEGLFRVSAPLGDVKALMSRIGKKWWPQAVAGPLHYRPLTNNYCLLDRCWRHRRARSHHDPGAHHRRHAVALAAPAARAGAAAGNARQFVVGLEVIPDRV